MQIHADPGGVFQKITNCGGGKGPTLREHDYLVVCASPSRQEPNVTSATHVLQIIRGAIVHGS